jgi:hypothetical protein
LEDDPHLKKFKLKLRSFSFSYSDFSILSGLSYIGDVKVAHKSFIIISTKNAKKSGALWHSLKQKIDMGFKTRFTFKFRNPLIHNDRGHGMNASIISGSVLGSPGRAS